MSKALIFLTHVLNDGIVKRFRRLSVPPGYEKSLLVDVSRGTPSPCCSGPVKYASFTFPDPEWNYIPLSKTLVPGSAHFPALQLVLKERFSQAWVVESDVWFTGEFRDFITAHEGDSDFVAARIRPHTAQNSGWHWWGSMCRGNERLPQRLLLASFNPVYRITLRAAECLDQFYRAGWKGHNEVTMPTLLRHAGFSVEDIGGHGPFVKSQHQSKWFTDKSHHWIKRYDRIDRPDTIYHPVKLNWPTGRVTHICLC